MFLENEDFVDECRCVNFIATGAFPAFRIANFEPSPLIIYISIVLFAVTQKKYTILLIKARYRSNYSV